MSFLLYLVVLVVSVTSVMMGLDWLSSPPTRLTTTTVQTAQAPLKPGKHTRAAKFAAATSGSGPAIAANAAAASVKTATTGTAASRNDGNDSTSAVNKVAAADDTPSPRCDVQACEMHYRTFRASDCTYQPFDGPRRFCNKGNPPANATPMVRTSDARQQPASCNYRACSNAYRSFDPATCTYQPFDGPRRLCEK